MSGRDRSGPWLAFDEAWFRRHQSRLLRVLNGPLRIWGRRIMAISPAECPVETDLLSIGPNRYTVAGGPGRLRTTFRTHPKYGKRVYRAFRPLWWAMHGWDWALADRFVPELSFGFATLTVYPDPHPEVTSVDGWVGHQSAFASFATLHGGSGNQSDDSSATALAHLMAASSGGYFYQLYRLIFLFDTSVLAGTSVTAATLSLACQQKNQGLGQTPLHIVSSAPASNTALATGDYDSLAATSFANITWSSIAIDAYNNFALNASGIANVNSSGISKFGARLGWDIGGAFGGAWQANQATNFYIYTADNTGTAYDPKLTVEYPGTAYLSRADSAALGATESRQLMVSMSRADSAALGASESTAGLLSLLNRSDSAALGATELSDLAIREVVELLRTDSAALGVLESSSVVGFDALLEIISADTAALGTSETSSVVAEIRTSDQAMLAVTEAAQLLKLRLPAPSAAGIRVAPWLKPGN